MPKTRSLRPATRSLGSVLPREIVEAGFIPVRAKLIEVAAFLDRVDRYRANDDFRCAALRDAARLLVDGKPERARRILERFSDPTTTAETVSSGKAALGAWQPAHSVSEKPKLSAKGSGAPNRKPADRRQPD